MTRGENYPYDSQKILGAQTKLHTMCPISKSKINNILNCTSTKLESTIRIKFVAEILQGMMIYSKMNTQV